jgi:hypothetical protein
MEEPMPAVTTRKEARERLLKLMVDSLDRIIPPDEGVPLRGQLFVEFEDQVEAFGREVLPALIEERAALDADAQAEGGGNCPHCGSDRIYLRPLMVKTEVISPHGSVVLHKQQARCRCCGRSFSPSRANVGVAGRGSADAPGGTASGAGGGGAAVRFGCPGAQ